MATTVWKGYISFGLISIPVRLFAAARSERISFNQLHKVCGTRLRQQLICPTCNLTVERKDIVKGYEYEKGQYVLVEEEEVKGIAPSSSETMEILEFVKLDEVDPLFFDSSFYALPEKAGRKPYRLLVETLGKSNYAAIAKIGMHQREYTVVIRPRDKGLTLHTMHYENELREVEDYGKLDDVEVKPQEVALAEQLVESLATSFDPSKYRDEYQNRLEELIEAKKAGQQVTAAEPRRMAPVIDLMEALKASLSNVPKKAPAQAKEAKETAPASRASSG